MGIEQKQPFAEGAEDLLQRVRGLPPERRRTLSVELAARNDAPPHLMRLLAQDEIVIAEPVILESPVLTDDDLCAIAKLGSPAHVAKLRLRNDLPVKVRDILETRAPLENKLLEMLRAGDIGNFCNLLAEHSKSDAASALGALDKGDAEPLVALCKRAQLSRTAYSSIVCLSDRSRSKEATELLLFAYETATMDAALNEGVHPEPLEHETEQAA